MSRDPHSILADFWTHSRQFLGWESFLNDRTPIGGPYPFSQPVCKIEKELACYAHWINHIYMDYKQLSAHPFSIPLRRAIDTVFELVEARLRKWGWDYAARPDGLNQIRNRLQHHEVSNRFPLLDAALSWRLGKNVVRHDGADDMACEAERFGIKSSMTPKEGEKVIWDRHRVWYTTPALAESIPSVTLEEYRELRSAVDELDRHIARLRMSPDQYRNFLERFGDAERLRIFLELGGAEQGVPHPAVEFGSPELPDLSGEETSEVTKRVSKALDPLQERMEKPLDTPTHPTTPPKGTPSTPERRQGQALRPEEKRVYKHVIRTAKDLNLPHRTPGNYAKISNAAKVPIEVVRNAMKWGGTRRCRRRR
jgi:hypothetical protein